MLSGSARRIVVVGSVNIDLMLRCPQVVAPGEYGVLLLLNPAPAPPLPAELLQSVDLLVPNAHSPAFPTTVRNITRAGNCFVGALAATLVSGQRPPQTITLAQRTAAFSVSRHGAQAAIPHRDDLIEP